MTTEEKGKELHQAIENGDLSKIEYLASTRNGLTFSQILQAMDCLKDCQSRLEEKKVPVNALMIAAELGDVQLCKHLLLEGADLNKDSPLSLSLFKGYYDISKLLIDSGADVNFLDNGITPMVCAIKESSPVFIVKDLLIAGADKNGLVFVDDYQHIYFRKRTPLICAILSKNIPVMKFLLENSVDVNITFDGTSSALLAAVFRGSFEMVKLLVDAGVNVEDDTQGFVFHLALFQNLDILELLVRKCLYVNTMINPRLGTYGKPNSNLMFSRNGTRLHLAVAMCHFDAVKILINNGANVNIEIADSIMTPLHVICAIQAVLSKEEKKDYLKIISLLIKNGASIDKNTLFVFAINKRWLALEHIIRSFGLYFDEKSALHLNLFNELIQDKKFDLIQLCIDYGANWTMVHDIILPVSQLSLTLTTTIENHEPIIARKLLKNIPYVLSEEHENELKLSLKEFEIGKAIVQNEIKLSEAIDENDVEKAKSALEYGAIPSGSVVGSKYPLHQASELGYYDVVNVLLEYGSPVNLIDCNGRSPLHLAASKGYLKICKSLLRHGASYDYPDPKGLSPLQLAQDQALGDSLEVVQLFKGVDKLFKMVRKGNTKVFKKLEKTTKSKEVLIFVNCVNKRGCTLMGEALRHGFVDIAEDILFLKFEADKSPEL